MKKLSNYVVAVLCVGSLAFSAGAFMKVNASPAVTAAPAGQPAHCRRCNGKRHAGRQVKRTDGGTAA